jgi:hypothetical protein
MNTGLCLTAVAIVDNFGIKAQSLVFVMGTEHQSPEKDIWWINELESWRYYSYSNNGLMIYQSFHMSSLISRFTTKL